MIIKSEVVYSETIDFSTNDNKIDIKLSNHTLTIEPRIDCEHVVGLDINKIHNTDSTMNIHRYREHNHHSTIMVSTEVSYGIEINRIDKTTFKIVVEKRYNG